MRGTYSPSLLIAVWTDSLNPVANLRYFFVMFVKTEPDGTGSTFAALAIFAILQIFETKQILEIVELAELGLLVAKNERLCNSPKRTLG